MRIVNPIYDTVFKYLLDDEKVARILLGALLGRRITELQFRPTEIRQEVGNSLLVLRMDFAATLRLEDGSPKLVLLEIQKAQNPMDVLRFRRYLGGEYANGENVVPGPGGRILAIPLVTIYFLGEGLDGIEAPVVRINRTYHDAATGETLRIQDPFVEGLTHDCVVVQVDRLKGRRRTELERLLMVFDQDQASKSDPHFLDILEENFPHRHREVLRRLIRATADKDVRDAMAVEDEFLGYLQAKERTVAELGQALAEALAEKDSALTEKDSALAAKDSALAEKDSALAEKDSALAEKDSALAEKDSALAEMDRTVRDLRRALARLQDS